MRCASLMVKRLNWKLDITVTQNERHGISNRWQLDCLFKQFSIGLHYWHFAWGTTGARWIPLKKSQKCGKGFYAKTYSWVNHNWPFWSYVLVVVVGAGVVVVGLAELQYVFCGQSQCCGYGFQNRPGWQDSTRIEGCDCKLSHWMYRSQRVGCE